MLRLMVVMRSAVVLALGGVLAGCGGSSVGIRTADGARAPASTMPPAATTVQETPTRTGPVGAGGAAASCVEAYDVTTIGNRAFAFDGTVTAIGPGTTNEPGKGGLETAAVTFQVNEWFKGGTGATVTVDLMSPGSRVGGNDATLYEEGTRLLVSGEPRWGGEPLQDAIAWSCGFTRYYEASVADDWRRGRA